MTERAEAIDLDLSSGDPDRVAVAVAELHQRLLSQRAIPVRPPPDDAFAAFAEGENDDLLVQLLKVLNAYPFEPSMTETDRLARMIDVVLRHGASYAARNLSLLLVIASSTAPALQQIAVRGVRHGQEEEQAKWLLSYLLDDLDSRRETIDGLLAWVGLPVLSDLLVWAGPSLTPSERAVLGLSAS